MIFCFDPKQNLDLSSDFNDFLMFDEFYRFADSSRSNGRELELFGRFVDALKHIRDSNA